MYDSAQQRKQRAGTRLKAMKQRTQEQRKLNRLYELHMAVNDDGLEIDVIRREAVAPDAHPVRMFDDEEALGSSGQPSSYGNRNYG